MSLKDEVVQTLRNQLKTAAEWLSKVEADTPQTFIAWSLSYMQQLTTATQELSKIEFPGAGATVTIPGPAVAGRVPEADSPRRRGRPSQQHVHGSRGGLSDYHKQAIAVMLSLRGGELPPNIAEVGVKTWKKEYNEDPSPSTRQRLYLRARQAFQVGLPRFREVLAAGNIPETEKDFYERIFVRYPNMTVAQLDEIIAHYEQGRRVRSANKGNKTDRRTPPPPPDPDSNDDEGATIPKPKTEWLQPLWAVLFHPNGPSLNRQEVMRRTGLGEQFFEPVMFGAIKNLHSIMSGDTPSPEPAFTDAIASDWPNQDLLEILTSISTGPEGELSLVSLHKEINNVQQDKSPRAKTEEVALQS